MNFKIEKPTKEARRNILNEEHPGLITKSRAIVPSTEHVRRIALALEQIAAVLADGQTPPGSRVGRLREAMARAVGNLGCVHHGGCGDEKLIEELDFAVKVERDTN